MNTKSSKKPPTRKTGAVKKVEAKKPATKVVATKQPAKRNAVTRVAATKAGKKNLGPAKRALSGPTATGQGSLVESTRGSSSPEVPASDIKRSWGDVVRKAHGPQGEVKISSHGHPQVFVLSPARHAELVEAEQAQARMKAATLDALRKEFDRRLASLKANDAGDKLRAAFAAPVLLEGSVKVGESH